MKGLEIAHDFLFDWGLPFLREEFPQLVERIAAGRLWGSEVLGGDDEISRDHNWGPQFDLFLTEVDYAIAGKQLSDAINAAAPNPWNGYRLAGAGDKSVRVECISEWFQRHVRMSHLPHTAEDWAGVSESALYFVRHGVVWIDGVGELTTWRSALHDYPKSVLRKRLAEECFRIWQYGEYNFVQRMALRRDPLAIAVCLGEFVTGVMRIVLLKTGDFTPFWKWLAFEFRKRPEAKPYAPILEELVATRDIGEQVQLVTRICGMVHESLLNSGWVTGENASPWLLPLLNDKAELELPKN